MSEPKCCMETNPGGRVDMPCGKPGKYKHIHGNDYCCEEHYQEMADDPEIQGEWRPL